MTERGRRRRRKGKGKSTAEKDQKEEKVSNTEAGKRRGSRVHFGVDPVSLVSTRVLGDERMCLHVHVIDNIFSLNADGSDVLRQERAINLWRLSRPEPVPLA